VRERSTGKQTVELLSFSVTTDADWAEFVEKHPDTTH
jgi:hypothetical protein